MSKFYSRQQNIIYSWLLASKRCFHPFVFVIVPVKVSISFDEMYVN